MNRLPDARRAIHARTWAQSWRPADFALAVAVGVGLALWMWEAMA